MKSCEQFLTEVEDKITIAEDQLRSEKNNTYKTSLLYKDMKEQWVKDIKAEQLKIHNKEKELRKMQQKLEEVKAEYEDYMKKSLELEANNENLKKQMEKLKKQQQEEMNRNALTKGSLEKELSKLQEQQRDLNTSNKWARVFQEKTLKAKESENESKVKDQVKELSADFDSRIEEFEDYLKDLERHNIKPKQQKLNELREKLAAAKGECEDMEKKNRELEVQIAVLEGLPAPR